MPEANGLDLPLGLSIETDPDLIASYAQGWRGEQGRAMFVARPSSTEEVSAIVRECVRVGIHLTPQSGRTGLVGASVPGDTERQGILSLERLRGTFELDRVNRSLTCSAGFRLSEINERLQDDGLFFPIDLGADPCIGGMVATNTGGSRLLRYGDVRANTMGLGGALFGGSFGGSFWTPRRTPIGAHLRGVCGHSDRRCARPAF